VHVRRGRLTARRAWRAPAAAVAACLLLSAWWYARSWIDTGNPLWPFRIDVAGRTLFEGPSSVGQTLPTPDRGADDPWPVSVGFSWLSDLLPWRSGSYDYQQRSGGFGPLWPWLGLPLLALGVLRWRHLRSRLAGRVGPALAVVLPVVAVFAVQPGRWWARFTLPLAALGVLAVVHAAQDLRSPVRRAALQGVATVLALLGAGLVLIEVDPAGRAESLPASQVVQLVGAPSEERTLGRLFFAEYAFVDDMPDDAVVLVDLPADAVRFVYPLFGDRLQRTVLPADDGPVPDDAWVVTGEGRPLDTELARTRPGPVSRERGVHAWAPLEDDGTG
jgi:hypothetical protein